MNKSITMYNNVYQPVGRIKKYEFFSCFCVVLLIAQNSQAEGLRVEGFGLKAFGRCKNVAIKFA